MFKPDFPLSKEEYEFIKNRKNSWKDTKTFKLTTSSPLIVNHGDESVLENSIALHPYYGFPIIPSSAIKGVMKHYLGDFCNEKEKDKVVFLDAWPKATADMKNVFDCLKIDVITPHYKDYYSGRGRGLPEDSSNPEPQFFLAVKEKTEFEFAIRPSSSFKNNSINLKKIEENITEALTNYGIGAKTGSNYGYFKK